MGSLYTGGWEGGGLYGEVKSIVNNGHMVLFPRGQTDRRDLKRYLPTTSLTGGKNDGIVEPSDSRKFFYWIKL